MLEAANSFAVSNEAKARVTKNLEIVSRNVRAYGDLEPIDSAPTLYDQWLWCNPCMGIRTCHQRNQDYSRSVVIVSSIPEAIATVFLERDRSGLSDKAHIAVSVFIILFMFFGK